MYLWKIFSGYFVVRTKQYTEQYLVSNFIKKTSLFLRKGIKSYTMETLSHFSLLIFTIFNQYAFTHSFIYFYFSRITFRCIPGPPVSIKITNNPKLSSKAALSGENIVF